MTRRRWIGAVIVLVEIGALVAFLWSGYGLKVFEASYRFFDKHLGGCQLTGC